MHLLQVDRIVHRKTFGLCLQVVDLNRLILSSSLIIVIGTRQS